MRKTYIVTSQSEYCVITVDTHTCIESGIVDITIEFRSGTKVYITICEIEPHYICIDRLIKTADTGIKYINAYITDDELNRILDKIEEMFKSGEYHVILDEEWEWIGEGGGEEEKEVKEERKEEEGKADFPFVYKEV